MPASVTHAYFVMDIYEELPIGLKKLLMDEKKRLRMFSQGMDSMYFYKIFSLGKGKRQRQFGHYFHEHQTQDFFVNLINYIKYNDLYKCPQIMAFLYGMISHYVLDKKLHPFVIYQAGWYDKNNKASQKYRNKHDEIETLLDLSMIKKNEKRNPYSFRLDQFCFDHTNFSDSLKSVINYTFQETYGIKNMSSFYCRSLKEMKYFLRWIRYDRFGGKKVAYQILELLTAKRTFRFHVLSYHLSLRKIDSYLNLEKEIWYHPVRKQEKHTESFPELYEKAKEDAIHLIQEVNAYLQDKKKVDLKKLFPNLSYLTGKDCEKNYPYRYFKENS